jgi:hypothetical protein
VLIVQFVNSQDIDATEQEALQTRQVELLADFHGTDESTRIVAIKSLRHDRSLWPELIRGLEERGTPELAANFCGFDQELTDAALKWAEGHGDKIVSYSRGIDI